MDTNSFYILCNIIPIILILVFIVDGWIKGALYMLVSIIRLVFSYYIAQLMGSLVANFLISIPYVNEQIAKVAMSQQSNFTNIPGLAFFINVGTFQNMVETITWWIIYGISFVIIFFLLMVFFTIILKITKFANKVPVLGKVNKLIGALEGLVFGVFIMIIVVYIAVFVLNIIGNHTMANILLTSWLPATISRFVN